MILVTVRLSFHFAMASKVSILQAVITLIFSFALAVNSFNLSCPAVFNFGDSNSDTGGVAAGVAFPIGPPNGQTYFHEPAGRFCDGRLILDFLLDAMGLPFLNPYLDSVGAPNFQKGCNFATGGAAILPATPAARNPFSFGIQVAQFARFKARVLELLSKDKTLQEYLPQEECFEQGLYMFDVGQNDLDRAFYSKSEDQVVASIPTILSEFEARIKVDFCSNKMLELKILQLTINILKLVVPSKRLYSIGARNFWIHNTGPLGCIPRIIAVFGKNASALDPLGCVTSHNSAANAFNAQLHDLCTNLRQQFPDATVTYVDIYSIKLNVISNFSQYGFKEPLAACCGYGGPPLNYDDRIACGQTKNLNGSTVTATPCNNTGEHVNWDGNHYTEAANRYIADQIQTGNYSDPPLSVNMPFLTRFSKLVNSKMLN